MEFLSLNQKPSEYCSQSLTLPRRQLLGDGRETDACTGNIFKHHHAALLAEIFAEVQVPLCPACAVRDGRRAAALIDHPDYKHVSIDQILTDCGMCDAHGFLITGKNAARDGSTETRQRLSKETLLDFSFALAMPDYHAESEHLLTGRGEAKEGGQMLLKRPARSGDYAFCIRYTSVGVGMDTEKWQMVVADEAERRRRHTAILCTLRDQLLSPDGALTGTTLPHLTGLIGAIVVRHGAGRAPLYSALEKDFVVQLQALAHEQCRVLPFATVGEFSEHMQQLITSSVPSTPTMPRSIVPRKGSVKKQHQGGK